MSSTTSPLLLILLGLGCMLYIGCQPSVDSSLEDSSVQTAEPDEFSANEEVKEEAPGIDEPAVVSVEPVEPEIRLPILPRPAPRLLNYALAPVELLKDRRGRAIQARIIATNDTQVRIQREDGEFFTSEIGILSLPAQARIRGMEGLPRIDETGQVLFPVYDFGAVGDGKTDDGPAIRAAVAAAIEGGPGSTVVFDEVDYRMSRKRGGSHIELESVIGLTLEGNGAMIIGNPYNGFLTVETSEDITMRGFVFDCDPLSFTQGDIIEANPATGELRLKLHPGYANPVELSEQLGEQSWSDLLHVIEPDERKLKRGPNDFFESITEESRADGLLRLKLRREKFSHINPGDRFVIGLLHSHRGPNIKIAKSSNVLLEDYTIHAGKWGMNHAFSDNLGRVRVNNGRIVHKPGSDRLITSLRDGFHVKHNAIGPIIENCVIEGIMDDSINISVTPYWVKDKLGLNRYLIANLSYAPRVGNRLVAYTPSTGKVSLDLKVLSVEEQPKQDGRRGKWNIIQLDRPIPNLALHTVEDLFPGGREKLVFTGLYNLDACGKDFIVRNNTFLEQRRHALLARSVGGLFEGNVIKNNNHNAVVLNNAVGGFYEGPFPGKITIRDNKFIRAGRDSIRIEIKGEGVWATDIVIEENVFEDWQDSAMTLSDVDGLIIRNNTIGPGLDQNNDKSPIQLSSSKNVLFENNTVKGDSRHGLDLTKISKIQVRGNQFLDGAGRPMSKPVNESRVTGARIEL